MRFTPCIARLRRPVPLSKRPTPARSALTPNAQRRAEGANARRFAPSALCRTLLLFVGIWLCLGAAIRAGAQVAMPVRPETPPPDMAPRPMPRQISKLFGEEIRQATAKLKWHGERLTDDTVYALALTGASWELAWNKEHLFSLAWGDCHKVPTLGKRNSSSYMPLIREVQGLSQQRDYQHAVALAEANFSLDEIGCDINLKEPVGSCLLGMGQPEQAFPIFAAPFEPTHSLTDAPDINRRVRENAFDAALRAGLTKEAIAFAFSLLLEPGADAPTVNVQALDYLESAGVDIDRVLLGILESPEHLHGLAAYTYAAADLLAYRASPRLLPFLLHLATSDDVYLRSRALVGLGVVAYQPRSGDSMDWARGVIVTPLRVYSVSAGERKLIGRALQEGANSDKYRVRAASALALALVGEDENVPLLQKLARDRTYVLADTGQDPRDRNRSRRLLFPVRMAAAAGLTRFGIHADPGGGDLTGRELEMARRGCQDQTNDRRNLRHEVASQILVSPVDVATAAPLDFPHR